MLVFYKFFKQLSENYIISLFKYNSNATVFTANLLWKIKYIWIIIFFSSSICAQDFDEKNTNLFEKNIELGFETPVNIWTINTVEDDFAPYFLDETTEFYYNSIVDGYSKYFVATPYLATDSNSYFNISFSSFKQLVSPLNYPHRNRAYFSIVSNDITSQKYAFINSSTHYNTGNYVNIHKTIFERNTWSEPTPIVELSGEYFIGHPTVSPAKDMLVFASNKNSADGSTDLWIAFLNNEQSWDMLAPLDELNSIGNEITPYFVSDSLLLFASDGFDGNGGYDLYYSIYVNGKWAKPTPLENINTEFNETDPTVLMNKYLVLASDRPGGKGKLDLYIADTKIQDKPQHTVYNFSLSATNYTLNITKTLSFDLIANSAIALLSNDKALYFNDTMFSISPQNIEFTIATDSNLNKTDLHYTIECKQKTLYNDVIEFENKNSYSWIVNFSKWNNEIFNADSVLLNVYHKQDLLRTLPLEIIKTETKEIKKHFNNNQNYYQIITTFADNINDYLSINENVINNISELLINAKHVEISTSKSYNSNKIFREMQDYFKTNAKFKLLLDAADNKLITLRIIM